MQFKPTHWHRFGLAVQRFNHLVNLTQNTRTQPLLNEIYIQSNWCSDLKIWLIDILTNELATGFGQKEMEEFRNVSEDR